MTPRFRAESAGERARLRKLTVVSAIFARWLAVPMSRYSVLAGFTERRFRENQECTLSSVAESRERDTTESSLEKRNIQLCIICVEVKMNRCALKQITERGGIEGK